MDYKSIKNRNIRRISRFVCQFCGQGFYTSIYDIKNGHTSSCGCHDFVSRKRRQISHGFSKDPLYSVYMAMMARCYNEKHKEYKNYGSRGISVCDEWIRHPISFKNYVSALPNYSEPGRTIDRVMVNGNYEPGNIQWATNHEQAANKRLSSKNTTGYTGVSFNKKSKKYVSYINLKGGRIHIGCYKSIKEAVESRNNYIRKHNLTEYKIQKYHG